MNRRKFFAALAIAPALPVAAATAATGGEVTGYFISEAKYEELMQSMDQFKGDYISICRLDDALASVRDVPITESEFDAL